MQGGEKLFERERGGRMKHACGAGNIGKSEEVRGAPQSGAGAGDAVKSEEVIGAPSAPAGAHIIAFRTGVVALRTVYIKGH